MSESIKDNNNQTYIDRVILTFILQSENYGTTEVNRIFHNTYREYIKKEFLGLRTSIGLSRMGDSRYPTTYIAFLKEDQDVSKGIYPVLLYATDSKQVIVAYGVSSNNSPNRKWDWNLMGVKKQPIKLKDYDLSDNNHKIHVQNKYGESYMYEYYNVSQFIEDYRDMNVNEFSDAGIQSIMSKYSFNFGQNLISVIKEYKKLFNEIPISMNPITEYITTDALKDQDISNEPIKDAEAVINKDGMRYWWLVASPKYWSFSELSVGDTVEYTVKNDKGNKRRVPINFEQAKEGDMVVGYEANPVKKIVALAKVVKASDGETISFQKVEELEIPIPFASFRNRPELSEMEFIKNQNGSFFKLTPEEYGVIMNLIRQENPVPEDANPIKRKEDIESYSREQFLGEVFMTEEKLDELIQLLRLKKNVILQGAPGVGKTFSAKRLAYCMMGEKDDSRIEMVQFHQNYSYEDFIMGYRPTSEGGFELRTGVFYNFCKKAHERPDKSFFFIIDEINRGNLSRIFGELLMLIENGYRNHPIKLAYRNEQFSVPGNLYIIGMMNTADRSLAMIDYALRRRFSFHPMLPGFDTEGFKGEMSKHDDPRIAKVVDAVIALNNVIENDDSLGSGFCIGHSYFCAQPTDQPWIEHVVRYDLCPMLDEYWFDSKEKRESEKKRLVDILKQ